MKKHLTQFALLLLVLLLPISAAAYEFTVDGIYYSRYQASSGTQVMVVKGDVPYSGDIVIPSEVTYEDQTYPVTFSVIRLSIIARR